MLSKLLSRSFKTFTSTLRLPHNLINLNNPTRFYFTSSSNSSQVALLEEVEAKIFQVLKTAAKCNTAKLNKNATFEELGFDSLDTV
jgi:U3 small nucleolar RNA-associated protein 14